MSGRLYGYFRHFLRETPTVTTPLHGHGRGQAATSAPFLARLLLPLVVLIMAAVYLLRIASVLALVVQGGALSVQLLSVLANGTAAEQQPPESDDAVDHNTPSDARSFSSSPASVASLPPVLAVLGTPLAVTCAAIPVLSALRLLPLVSIQERHRYRHTLARALATALPEHVRFLLPLTPNDDFKLGFEMAEVLLLLWHSMWARRAEYLVALGAAALPGTLSPGQVFWGAISAAFCYIATTQVTLNSVRAHWKHLVGHTIAATSPDVLEDFVQFLAVPNGVVQVGVATSAIAVSLLWPSLPLGPRTTALSPASGLVFDLFALLLCATGVLLTADAKVRSLESLRTVLFQRQQVGAAMTAVSSGPRREHSPAAARARDD